MSLDANVVLATIAIGIGAAACMDVWNLFLYRAFGIPSLNYCLLGRWVRHMPGTFAHANIAAAPPKANECAVGWVAHYAIGAALAGMFVALVSRDWLTRPTVLPALLYGIGTVVLPFLLMQPALGLGVAASRAPKPARARLKSLMTHVVFGIGLYACALPVSYVLRFMREQPFG